MTLTWTRTAAIFGLLGVGLGAFGAHGLESVANEEQLEWWATATLYLMLHVAALLALDHLSSRPGVRLAGSAFVVGALLFSGTLYAMGLGGPRWLGAITPLGGAALMVGWGALIYASSARTADRAQSSA